MDLLSARKKDNIFIIKRSEITGRLDPHYNQPLFSKLWDKLYLISGELTTLRKNSICIFSGITPKSGGDAYTLNDGVPFVRSGDFSEMNEIDFSKLLRLKREIHDGIMCGSQLQKNDLLIAIVGATIGKVGVYQYDIEANINQAICAIRLKNTLNPYYVQAFFQTYIGQKIIERITRPVARANINLEEVGNLPIPLLDLHKQNEIAQIMGDSRLQKQAKERDANALLASIDDYLLSELGIERPTLARTENGRFFYTSFKEIEGGELAPISVQNRGKQSKSTQYKEIKLPTIASITKGQAITSKEIVDGEYPVIAGGQSSPYTHNQYNHKGDVITVSASGAYSGYVWYHDYPIFASDCSVIFSKDNNVFLTKYIYEILRVRQKEIYLLQKGAGQPHVYASDLAQITIPVVSIEKQMEIILHCNNLRIAAAELTQEGKNLVESAKMTIEAMILGE